MLDKLLHNQPIEQHMIYQNGYNISFSSKQVGRVRLSAENTDLPERGPSVVSRACWTTWLEISSRSDVEVVLRRRVRSHVNITIKLQQRGQAWLFNAHLHLNILRIRCAQRALGSEQSRNSNFLASFTFLSQNHVLWMWCVPFQCEIFWRTTLIILRQY